MSKRLNDFLAREAGDYLERVSRLLTSSAAPEVDELLRLARGVRGSARMAGAGEIAGIAERLEREARELAGGASAWSEEARERCLRLAAEMESLLHAQDDDVIPISDLFYDDDLPQLGSKREPAGADAAGAAEAGAAIVPIDELLYSGESALAAAGAIRPALAEALAAGDRDRARVLLDELFDLIHLARPAPG